MPQHELNRRIAAVTGERVADIARMGFQIDGPPSFAHFDDDLGPIDWDEQQARRRTDMSRCGRGKVAFH
ncbi:hypothetical protein [Alienimonas californiensis]|uniref:Uncharacterized protein n=1 Tax=Alienimonas californiensis TaxID=2527989 RepID=A0A517P490_9PLAN|nr:hypothetical protein [Alienimonas californiensis]QDT14212.1 hypothetical protein CA12_02810 [Alienimonas californiensis]